MNIGLGHLAWDMIWAHVGPWARAPCPGARPRRQIKAPPPRAPPGPGPGHMGPNGPRGQQHIQGKVS